MVDHVTSQSTCPAPKPEPVVTVSASSKPPDFVEIVQEFSCADLTHSPSKSALKSAACDDERPLADEAAVPDSPVWSSDHSAGSTTECSSNASSDSECFCGVEDSDNAQANGSQALPHQTPRQSSTQSSTASSRSDRALKIPVVIDARKPAKQMLTAQEVRERDRRDAAKRGQSTTAVTPVCTQSPGARLEHSVTKQSQTEHHPCHHDSHFTRIRTAPDSMGAADSARDFPILTAPLNDEAAHDVCGRVRRQIEFYLSPANLSRDTFLLSQMECEGWVHVELLATFPRVRLLTLDHDLILHALSMSR